MNQDNEQLLNQSEVNAFMQCPERWRRRFVERHIIPPPFALHRGISVHKGAEHNWSQKIESHEDRPAKEIVEVAVETLKTTVRNEGVWLSPDEETIGTAVLMDKTEKSVASLSELYAVEVAGLHQPIEVEHRHSFKLPSGVTIHGRMDIITDCHDVVDLKTHGKKPSLEEYEKSIQTRMYALLHTLVFGKAPRSVIIEALIDKAKPEALSLILQPQREDFASLLTQVDAVARAMQSGIVTYAYGQTGAWWCSRNSCGYWSTCPAVPPSKR